MEARRFSILFVLGAFVVLLVGYAFGQTASTGSLTGTAFDPSGSILPGIVITLTQHGTNAIRSARSESDGGFRFLLLSPGRYQVQARTQDSPALTANSTVTVSVTDTVHVNLHLQVETVFHSINVSGDVSMVQTDSSALGKVVRGITIVSLPLVTRNFAQIVSLAPGVTSGVYNAGELGVGGTALSQIANSNDGIYVHGARSYDNNFQIDGISVNDLQGSGASSGGIPIPNPDSIQEFKVQTGLYDAAYGRYGGANVALITKSGGNALHGTVFEFLRNELLNANDFFLNRTHQSRPVLKQNQFGIALGGPIKKDKLHFFESYQGTRQVNGIAAGQSRVACTASLSEPPLTNNRSAAELGKIFGGMTGAHGILAIKQDGSNINPSALALLNLKLPDGSFLIPTPQTVDPSKPLVQQGFSVFTDPCSFNEDQFQTNLDYLAHATSKVSGRFFVAHDDQSVTFPGNGLNPAGNIPGFLSPGDSGFIVFSLSHTYSFRNTWLNEARTGYVRTRASTGATTPFKWSDIGVAEGEMSHNNALPSLEILGSVSVAAGFPRIFAQNTFTLADNLSTVRGTHTLRMGGSLTRVEDNINLVGLGSFLQFLSWPDFLLGLAAAENGTPFSNVFASYDAFGLATREFRAWEGTAFVQDDYKIRKSLTLNIGARYERFGQFGDRLGRNASFDIEKANPNPPLAGSLGGYVVGSSFPGVPPPGVLRSDNNFGNDGEGQNTLAPRIGFAWQFLPRTNRLVLRGGYGLYYSRPTGQGFYQNALGAPFTLFRLNAGSANAAATFQAPFPQPFPTPASFPLFPAYSPNTVTTIHTTAPDFRPARIQQYSLNVQAELYEGWLLEAGYVGTRGDHLMRARSANQALPASTDTPRRGATTNTVANIPLRVPIPGIPADSLRLLETAGESQYNGLELSLKKDLSYGLQFLASYTFSKALDSDGSDINSVSAGTALTLGDQNSPRQRWGRASIDRTHRLVFSTTWSLPMPSEKTSRAVFGGWSVAAIATIQSGSALTIADTNSTNVFGITQDRAALSGTCSKSQLVRAGRIESKLNGYFNASCFSTPPVIGADGIGTGFGNSATGIVDGPGQANLDLALWKAVPLHWPTEHSVAQFRAEFYNAMNHPQFAKPDSNFSSPAFGEITSTAVSSRVGQIALKLEF